MKFILNEKYILNETKFSLNEKFILIEKTLQDHLENTLTAIKNIQNSFSKLLSNNEVLDTVLKKLDILEKELNDIPDINSIKTKTTQFATALESELNNIDKNWGNNYPELKNKLKQTNNKNFLNIIKEAVTNYKTAKKIEITNEEKEDIEKVINKCNNLLDDNTKLTKNELEPILNEVEQISVALKNIYTQINSGKSINILDLSNKALQLLEKLRKSNTNNPEEDKKETEENDEPEEDKKETEENSEEDWDTRYEKCLSANDFTFFWNDYYKIEWGENAEKIKSFGKAFIDEVENWGFSNIDNPFIGFLKKAIKNQEIWSKLDKNRYAILHNAVVNYLLTKNDIWGKGLFKEHNIIFNPKLYDLNATSMKTYLEYQKSIIDNKENLPDDYTDDRAWILLNNIMYTGGDSNNILNAQTAEMAAKTNFRNSIDIKHIIKNALNIDIEEKTVASNKDIENYLINTNAQQAKKMILFLLEYFRRGHEKLFKDLLAKNDNLVKLVNNKNFERPTLKETDQYLTQIQIQNKQYTDDALRKLFTELTKKAWQDETNKKQEENK